MNVVNEVSKSYFKTAKDFKSSSRQIMFEKCVGRKQFYTIKKNLNRLRSELWLCVLNSSPETLLYLKKYEFIQNLACVSYKYGQMTHRCNSFNCVWLKLLKKNYNLTSFETKLKCTYIHCGWANVFKKRLTCQNVFDFFDCHFLPYRIRLNLCVDIKDVDSISILKIHVVKRKHYFLLIGNKNNFFYYRFLKNNIYHIHWVRSPNAIEFPSTIQQLYVPSQHESNPNVLIVLSNNNLVIFNLFLQKFIIVNNRNDVLRAHWGWSYDKYKRVWFNVILKFGKYYTCRTYIIHEEKMIVTRGMSFTYCRLFHVEKYFIKRTNKSKELRIGILDKNVLFVVYESTSCFFDNVRNAIIERNQVCFVIKNLLYILRYSVNNHCWIKKTIVLPVVANRIFKYCNNIWWLTEDGSVGCMNLRLRFKKVIGNDHLNPSKLEITSTSKNIFWYPQKLSQNKLVIKCIQTVFNHCYTRFKFQHADSNCLCLEKIKQYDDNFN